MVFVSSDLVEVTRISWTVGNRVSWFFVGLIFHTIVSMFQDVKNIRFIYILWFLGFSTEKPMFKGFCWVFRGRGCHEYRVFAGTSNLSVMRYKV